MIPTRPQVALPRAVARETAKQGRGRRTALGGPDPCRSVAGECDVPPGAYKISISNTSNTSMPEGLPC